MAKNKQKEVCLQFDIRYLFAGIGGIRRPYQKLGGTCVFSSEIDKFAVKTYDANWGETPSGDITKIDEKDIPKFDICLAGFPCQAFSIAGSHKGFDDDFKGINRGNLFSFGYRYFFCFPISFSRILHIRRRRIIHCLPNRRFRRHEGNRF